MRLLKNMLSNNLEPTKHISSASVFGERAVYLPDAAPAKHVEKGPSQG